MDARALVVAALVGALALGACGGRPSRPDSGPSGQGTIRPLPTTSDPDMRRLSLSWADRAAALVLPDGSTITHCPGEAPMWCADTGAAVGVAIEVVQFPASAIDELRGGASAASLRRWAEGLVAGIAADREVGCPAGYRFVAAPVQQATVVGQPGVRYAFRGTTAEGTSSEVTVGHATVIGDTLVILLSAAYDPEGCLPPEGPGLTVDQLDTLAPFLARIAADSAPPPLR